MTYQRARPKPFTPEELHTRAVQRRDAKREYQKWLLLTKGAVAADRVFDNRAPHANRGTPERLHFQRR